VTICEYGCNREAVHQFKNGKWCCEHKYQLCPNFKNHLKNISTIEKFKAVPINTIELCSYGCGDIAKYKFNNGKICCSEHHLKCKKIHNKTIINQTLQKIKTNELCYYGCGKIASYILPKSEKYCCSKNWSQCSAIKNKNSETNIIKQSGINNARHGIKLDSLLKDKIRRSVLKAWKNPNSLYHSESFKQKLKDRWKNEDFLKKWSKAKDMKPNLLEKHMLEILNNLFPDEYEYVGNFSDWIGGKNPDFKHKEKMKVIEVFGDYWHSKELTGIDEQVHERERISHFKKYNYDTLIIWEHEFKNLEKLKLKLIEFCEKEI